MRCEQREAILVKGVSHPIHTYQILDLVNRTAQKDKVLGGVIPGLSLALDPYELEDHDAARQLLSAALKSLNPKLKKPSRKK